MKRRALPALRLAIGLGLLVAGLQVVDRPGLRTEYFALSDAWRGEPVFTQVSPPRLRRVEELGRILHSLEVFSIRWSGWIAVAEPGVHRFDLVADEEAYLRVGEELVVGREGGRGAGRLNGTVSLERGLHRIELGLAQRQGPTFLQVLVTAPGRDAAEVDPDALWPQRVGALARLGRWSVAGWSLLERRLLAGLLLLAGSLVLIRLADNAEWPAARRRALHQRAVEWSGGEGRLRGVMAATALAVLAVVLYRVMFRLAGSPLGFDDVRYLDTAFNRGVHGWMVDRYVHVYLMKAWQAFFPTDVFLAARHYWAAIATVTGLSLAVGVFSLGSGLQLGTLTVALWLLLSQSVMYLTAGAMWSDYTTMAFVTLAVAVVLHRTTRARPPLWELHAFVLGALTLGAVRSKATGAVVAWLALTFLWENGRLDIRRAVKKTSFWLAGLVVAQILVMTIDARALGDAWFSLRSYSHEAAGRVHFEVAEPEALRYGWIDQVWPRLEGGELAVFDYFPLALLVAVALAVAAATRQKPERLVIHLLPFAYLGALLLLQIRGTYGALPRHLFPIAPAAALTGAALFHYAGIDRIGWREIRRPRFFVPLFAASFLTFLVVVPTVNGELTAGELAPLAAAAEDGWSSTRAFGQRALIPAGLALVALAAPFAARRREGRVVLLLSACLLLLANETADTARLHATRRPGQRSDMIVYPWAVFETQIRDSNRVVVSPHLIRGGQRFFGPRPTVERVARLYYRDHPLRVTVQEEINAEVDAAFASPADLERWERMVPGVGATAEPDPFGHLVLVRPRRAAEGKPR